MGFHTRQYPDLSTLQGLRAQISDDREFLRRVIGTGADAWTGSTESAAFLEEVIAGLESSTAPGINTQ